MPSLREDDLMLTPQYATPQEKISRRRLVGAYRARVLRPLRAAGRLEVRMPIGIYPRKSLENRFWEKVIKSDGCWNWSRYLDSWGYGRFQVKGRMEYAHRVSYQLAKGEIPEGLELDHLCLNPACVRPDHLEAVLPRTNKIRGFGVSGKNIRKTHCVNGHAFVGSNIRWTTRGTRSCRECDNIRRRATSKGSV